MAITTVNLNTESIGGGGVCIFDLPVAAATHIYKGQLVSQLADGTVVPTTTANGGVCIGVAQHEADNPGSAGAVRVAIESRRIYALANGATTDAFSEASAIGSVAYALGDAQVADNSASGTLLPVGFFYGMEADGKVRVLVDPPLAKIVAALITLTDAPASADALRENIVAAFG